MEDRRTRQTGGVSSSVETHVASRARVWVRSAPAPVVPQAPPVVSCAVSTHRAGQGPPTQQRTLTCFSPCQRLALLGHILPCLAEGDPPSTVGSVHSLKLLVARSGGHDTVWPRLRQVTHGVIPACRLAVALLLRGALSTRSTAAAQQCCGLLLLLAAVIAGRVRQVVIHLQVTVVALHPGRALVFWPPRWHFTGKAPCRPRFHHGGASPEQCHEPCLRRTAHARRCQGDARLPLPLKE